MWLALTETSHGSTESTVALLLAEQLMWLVKNHYQGDARPIDRVADFKDENA